MDSQKQQVIDHPQERYVTNILRDHLFITGEFGTSLALYFDIKAVLKQRMRR